LHFIYISITAESCTYPRRLTAPPRILVRQQAGSTRAKWRGPDGDTADDVQASARDGCALFVHDTNAVVTRGPVAREPPEGDGPRERGRQGGPEGLRSARPDVSRPCRRGGRLSELVCGGASPPPPHHPPSAPRPCAPRPPPRSPLRPPACPSGKHSRAPPRCRTQSRSTSTPCRR